IIGLIRGRYSYKSNLEIEKTNIVNSLKDCCKIAEDAGVILLLEPINRFEIDSCNTIKESIKLIEEVNSDYLKLMIDSFHMHLEEDPELIWTELDSYHSLIQHVHLADDTRRAPGTGHINFKRLIGVLEKNNYNEFYSFETIMKPSFEKIAKDSIKYLRSLKI
ncbi:MAG: sugar phosphate isomerase/epimerase family protein, partial [Candidatus Helarchaeota archaeon]